MGANTSSPSSADIPVYESLNKSLFPSTHGSKIQLADGRNLGYAEYGVLSDVESNKHVNEGEKVVDEVEKKQEGSEKEGDISEKVDESGEKAAGASGHQSHRQSHVNAHTVVLLHGIPGSRLFCHPDTALLSQLGIRLVVIDRPGIGFSDSKKKLTFLDFANDVEELMNFLHIDRFSVLGYSAGTPWALAVAHKMPDRINNVAIVSSLAPKQAPNATKGMPFIFQTAYFLADKAPSLLASIAKSQAQDYLKAPVKTGRTDFSRYHKTDFEIYKKPEIEQLFLQSALEMYTQQKGWVAEAHEYSLWCSNWGFDLQDIKCKVGIWHGLLDRGTTRHMSDYIVTKLQNCEKFYVDDVGHLVFFTHYEQIMNYLVRAN